MVEIKKVTKYTDELDKELKRLMEILTPRAEGKEIDRKMMEDMVSSPLHDIYIAVDESGKVVGTISFSQVLGPFAGGGRTVFMEDFSVDPECRGEGVGSKLWDTMIEWCKERDVKKIEFTSRKLHEGSHGFYDKRGAKVRDTKVFRVPLVDGIHI